MVTLVVDDSRTMYGAVSGPTQMCGLRLLHYYSDCQTKHGSVRVRFNPPVELRHTCEVFGIINAYIATPSTSTKFAVLDFKEKRTKKSRSVFLFFIVSQVGHKLQFDLVNP